MSNRIYLACAASYLHAGDLVKAEDTVKYCISLSEDTKFKIRSLLLLSMIKENMQEKLYAKLYARQAVSLLKSSLSSRNTDVFLQTVALKIVTRYIKPEDWLLTAVEKRLFSDSAPLNDHREYAACRNPYLAAAALFQKSGNRAEAVVQCFQSYTPGENFSVYSCQMDADYARLLVRQEKWEMLIRSFWGVIDTYEYYHYCISTCTYSQPVFNSIAFVFGSLALAVQKAAPEVVYSAVHGSWPVCLGNRTDGRDELSFKLIQLAKKKGLSPVQLRITGGFAGGIKRDLSELHKKRERWFALKLADPDADVELNRKRIMGIWTRIYRLSVEKAPDDQASYLSSLDREDIQIEQNAVFIEFDMVADYLLRATVRNNWLSVSVLPVKTSRLKSLILRFKEQFCSQGRAGRGAECGRALYAALFENMDVNLRTVETCCIAPDEAISQIPFNLLVDRTQCALSGKSLSLMPCFFVMQQMQARESDWKPESIALMGDPLPLDIKRSVAYTGNTGSRIANAIRNVSVIPKNSASPSLNNQAGIHTSVEMQYSVLHRIPYTAVEVKTIKKLAKKKQWETKTLLAEQFTKQAVFKLLSQRLACVHFASHALISYEIPYIMEPCLFVSASGRRPIDHFILSREIERLSMEGTKLVVLSACKTGVNVEYNNNGITSLAESFMKAGVSNIIFTLWSIDDKATSQFMAYFYRTLFQNGDINEAFTEARHRMKQHPRYQDPYYWAGFVLYGV